MDQAMFAYAFLTTEETPLNLKNSSLSFPDTSKIQWIQRNSGGSDVMANLHLSSLVDQKYIMT